jgi:hypothetical protein
VSLFKKAGIQSISFNIGIQQEELNAFIEVFTSPTRFPDAEAMIKGLMQRGVRELKINHVFYKKVTLDDKIVQKDTDRPVSTQSSEEATAASKKQFMEMILESVLSEEVQKSISLKNLMADPGGLSKSMLAVEDRHREEGPADAESGIGESGKGSDRAGVGEPGTALMYQLQLLHDDVERNLEDGETANLAEMTDAIFEMKRQLIAGIETQKTLHAAYENETRVLDQVNELADNVLIKLIRDEYQKGKISTQRLAHILRRLVPDPFELKRILPKIKAALLGEGMAVSDYLSLIQHLGKELQSEGLSKVLQDAAESVGVDGEELIEEIRKKPEQAAQLMALAAEIQKGTGDEAAFTELLVNYVEKLGVRMRGEAAENGGTQGEAHVRQEMDLLETGLMKQLKGMDLSTETLVGIENRIQARIDALFEKQGGDWTAPRSAAAAQDSRPEKTLLQLMEQGVTTNEELVGILKNVRSKAEAGDIGENDFEAIYAEIQKHEEAAREKASQKKMPTGVLRPSEFKFYLEKEIFRASRHGLAFSTLAFTIVKAQPERKIPKGKSISQFELLNAVYRKLVDILRDTDIMAELERNKMAALLPMTTKQDANLAMRRITKLLHENSIEVNGIPVRLIIACSATIFDPEITKDVESYIQTMNKDLDNIAQRVKNIHNLA